MTLSRTQKDLCKPPGGARTLAYDMAAGRWLDFGPPLEVLAAENTGQVMPLLEELERRVEGERLWAAGWVAYEAAPAFDSALVTRRDSDFPPAWFSLHREPLPAEPPQPVESTPKATEWTAELDQESYGRAIEVIRERIRDGDTYQVNFTYRLRAFPDIPPFELFACLLDAQGRCYGFYLETPEWVAASASPELFFRLEGESLFSRPMKGTAARGLGWEDDRARGEALARSEKDRAENIMIVDMVRNDMGRVARTGSVRTEDLFRVERLPTLWQMTGGVRCETDSSLAGIFGALFPPASITGAPRASTMKIIAGLERSPRRIYTGAAGFVGPGRRAQFNVAIRTLLLDRRSGAAEYGVGGGVVWDSTAGSEYDESRAKALVLTRSRPRFGLLETLLWEPGKGWFLLEEHLERLGLSAEYFGFRLDLAELEKFLERESAAFGPGPWRARLTGNSDGEPKIEACPLKLLPAPYTLGLARTPVDPADPFLYHKTTNRAVYERARAERPDCADTLLWNTRGEVTETCITNVLYRMEENLYTPPVDCGLLAGIYRNMLLKQGEIKERVLRVDELSAVQEFRLVNSVRGSWAVEMRGDEGR